MKIYKIAQNNLTQWELKQKIKPLQDRYNAFWDLEHNRKLLPEEEQEFTKVSNELDRLGKLLDQKIDENEQISKKLISQGREHEVTPSNFMRYHNTGFIAPNAYDKYKTKEGAEVTQDVYNMGGEQRKEYLEEKGWHMEADDIINEKGQIVPSYESLIYNQWLSLTPLYKNDQLYFKGYMSQDSIWHGTTLSRAKSAYPELLGGTAPGIAASVVKNKIESWYKSPFLRAMNYV